jgi:hypothetical protein
MLTQRRISSYRPRDETLRSAQSDKDYWTDYLAVLSTQHSALSTRQGRGGRGVRVSGTYVAV